MKRWEAVTLKQLRQQNASLWCNYRHLSLPTPPGRTRVCAASDGFSSASSPLVCCHFLPGIILGEFSPKNGFCVSGVCVKDGRPGSTSEQRGQSLLWPPWDHRWLSCTLQFLTILSAFWMPRTKMIHFIFFFENWILYLPSLGTTCFVFLEGGNIEFKKGFWIIIAYPFHLLIYTV